MSISTNIHTSPRDRLPLAPTYLTYLPMTPNELIRSMAYIWSVCAVTNEAEYVEGCISSEGIVLLENETLDNHVEFPCGNVGVKVILSHFDTYLT